MPVRDPILDPAVYNRVTEQAVQHYEDTLRLLIQNIFPRGYMAGQEPETDKLVELSQLISSHDHHLSVAADPNALPGDRMRANKELLREQELRNELFNERS